MDESLAYCDAGQQAIQRRHAVHDTRLGQRVLHGSTGVIGFFFNKLLYLQGMHLERRIFVTSALIRCKASGLAPSRHLPLNRGSANLAHARYRALRMSCLHSVLHAFPQIWCLGLCHPGWPPSQPSWCITFTLLWASPLCHQLYRRML